MKLLYMINTQANIMFSGEILRNSPKIYPLPPAFFNIIKKVLELIKLRQEKDLRYINKEGESKI